MLSEEGGRPKLEAEGSGASVARGWLVWGIKMAWWISIRWAFTVGVGAYLIWEFALKS